MCVNLIGRRTRRPFTLVLLAWYLLGCSSFRPTDVRPQEAVTGQKRIIVEVADTDGLQTVRLRDPWATADSIGGYACDRRWSCDPPQALSYPLSSVQKLETYRSDAALNLLVTVVTLGAVAGVVVLHELSKIGS